MLSIPLASRTTTTLAVALIAPALFYKLKLYPSFASLYTLYDRLVWTIRAAVLPSPLPRGIEQWMLTFTDDPDTNYGLEQRKLEMESFYRSWKFLEPLFASRGYILYTFFKQPTTRPKDNLIAAPSDPDIRRRNVPEYPYARRFYNVDEDIEAYFSYSSLIVWPARDFLGRDVVIKIVADETKRNELEILQALNTDSKRRDPRNHTIPVIEFIKFQQYTFVVMPRWHGGLWLDFGTVDELMWFAQSMLEVFDFLHEHHIVHFDFLSQNLGINVLSNVNKWWAKGLLQRSVTRYALFDFGQSKQYPLDIPIDEVQDTRFFGFDLRGYPEPEGPYNPFQVEMLSVGDVLQRNVRHIENIIPTLGPFFDAMMNPDATKRLTARQALNNFQKIYSSLSKSELNTQVVNLFWDNGVVTPKENLQES
ncbi:hypothetical protein BJ912DRAFT_909635 [Pholiota molesta]|nr:hypothetical protein BJ912DRAFT_909635 [Pholiota molesta]